MANTKATTKNGRNSTAALDDRHVPIKHLFDTEDRLSTLGDALRGAMALLIEANEIAAGPAEQLDAAEIQRHVMESYAVLRLAQSEVSAMIDAGAAAAEVATHKTGSDQMRRYVAEQRAVHA